MYTNRAMGIKDVDSVFRFCRELKGLDAKMTFADIENREELLGWLQDENVYLYVSIHESGDVVGLFRAKRGLGNKNHSVDIAAAVGKKYRKKAVASSLTLYGLEDVKTKGVLIARTYIYSWNKASIATIKKCGFLEAGRKVMHQYEPFVDGYIDDVIFHKIL